MSFHKSIFKPIIAGTLLLLTGIGCAPSETDSWVPTTQGPWNGALYLATSVDGLNFSQGSQILTQAGVPHLLQKENSDIVLTYQYFSSTNKDMFDVIAYSISSDNGSTWSEPAAVTFTNLPEPAEATRKPMDPTLVETKDGGLALYFTYDAKGQNGASLFVATSASQDLTQPFTVQATPALQVPGANLLDPAVIFFNNTWHHYSWQDKSNNNYHSTSTDGLTFTRQKDIPLNMDFLGQAIMTDTGIRFYGTSEQGVMSAFSQDGSTWILDNGSRAMGADPGVLRLSDENYLMVYTKVNFNEEKKESSKKD